VFTVILKTSRQVGTIVAKWLCCTLVGVEWVTVMDVFNLNSTIYLLIGKIIINIVIYVLAKTFKSTNNIIGITIKEHLNFI